MARTVTDPLETDPCAPGASRTYSRGERLSDAIVHLAALTLALGAVPVLVTFTAARHGTATGGSRASRSTASA